MFQKYLNIFEGKRGLTWLFGSCKTSRGVAQAKQPRYIPFSLQNVETILGDNFGG